MSSSDQALVAPKKLTGTATRGISLIAAGSAQFAGQALGILVAVLVSYLIARRMGVGAEADAFLLGRRLVTSLTEALSQVVGVVFIPLVAARAAAGVSLWRILGQSGGAALALGAALATAIAFTASDIVVSLAPEFGPDTKALASQVVIILALSLPATVAAMAFSAYCNVRGRFGAPTVIRQLPRAAVALALLFGGGALALQAAAAYTITFFGVATLTLILALGLGAQHQTDMPTKSVPTAVGRRGASAILLTFGALACIWLETAVAASLGSGSLAMLDFSQRLGALCGNTLAMALALVAFADLSRRAAAGAKADLGRRFRNSTLIGISLLIPVQLGFFLNAGSVVDIIIAHDQIGADTIATMTELVRWMALAPLGAFVARMMLVRLLAEDGLPIVRLVGLGMALDFGSRWLMFTVLTPILGLVGIPIALILSPAVPVIFLAIMLRRRHVYAGNGAFRAARPMMAAAVLGSAGILAGAAAGPWLFGLLQPLAGNIEKLDSVTQLFASGMFGLLALGAGMKLFGVKLRPK